MIGGHSKFLLVTEDCCRKRWQLLSCLLPKALRNESVQLGTGVAVPFQIPSGKLPIGGILCLPLVLLLALCFLAVFPSKFSTSWKHHKQKGCKNNMPWYYNRQSFIPSSFSSQGGVEKWDDNCCPATQSFEKGACSAGFLVPALCWRCESFQFFFAQVFLFVGILCVPLVFQ